MKIAVQDEADAEKKTFVGGQHLRYTGTLAYYSSKTEMGQVKIDAGYAMEEKVPDEIVVEIAEMNCAGKKPFGMKDLSVEFGIWKTVNGKYKAYNLTLPGGIPITKESLEHRQ